MSQSVTIQFEHRKTTDYIVIHCAATDEQEVTARDIDGWHRKRGFLCIGYHYVIRRSGQVEIGRPLHVVGAHVLNFNATSIGICMVGGGSTKEKNNFTPEQWAALEALVREIRREYPSAVIQGHRDFPNVDKWCPSFNAKAWATEKGLQCESPSS